MGWYLTPEERERAACEALAPQWALMQRERRERDAAEAAAFAEMWTGIEVGDVVEVSEVKHVRDGGLLLVDERTGEVKAKQVKVLEVKGGMAKVAELHRDKRGLTFTTTEWLKREDLGRVVKPGLAKSEESKSRYWEQQS